MSVGAIKFHLGDPGNEATNKSSWIIKYNYELYFWSKVINHNDCLQNLKSEIEKLDYSLFSEENQRTFSSYDLCECEVQGHADPPPLPPGQLGQTPLPVLTVRGTYDHALDNLVEFVTWNDANIRKIQIIR